MVTLNPFKNKHTEKYQANPFNKHNKQKMESGKEIAGSGFEPLISGL